MLHWPAGSGGRGALLTGDTITVVPDRDWVSFMWSYPNLIPLDGASVLEIARRAERFTFDRVYGGWWGRVVVADGAAAVRRSADRYVARLRGERPSRERPPGERPARPGSGPKSGGSLRGLPGWGYTHQMSTLGDRGSRDIAVEDWYGLDMATPGPVDAAPEDSLFPPIGEYGFLSDCETTALIAPSGNVEWLCLPRIDSPSVFGSILDRSAGGFRLGPEGITVPAARRYLPGTMVLETSWATPTGWLVVRDALLMGPWHHDNELSHTHRRTPTDYDADHVLLRTIRCVTGEVQVTFECEPVFDYGRNPGDLVLR